MSNVTKYLRKSKELRFSIQDHMYRLFRVFAVQVKREEGKKVYLLLFTCSLSRAIHLEVLPNQITQEKQLIARGVIPKVLDSDNVKTFVAASK